MSAAATEAVVVIRARLSIALIFKASDMATTFASINWDIIRIVSLRVVNTCLFKWVDMLWIINFVFSIHAIVNLWSECTWAEASLDYCMACLRPVSHGCTTTCACTVLILLARHAFALVIHTISWTWSLFRLVCGFSCDWFDRCWFYFWLCGFRFRFFFDLWGFRIELWCDAMAGWFHRLFTVFMLSLICFTVAWLWQWSFTHHLLFFDLSSLLCLFLCSNSVMLLGRLTRNLQTLIHVMWDNWFQMRVIWS